MATTTAAAGEGMRAHILVAEDDPAMCDLLRDYLSAQGHQISVVQNGLSLLERMSDPKLHFDLIVADVRMPVLSGVEVLAMTARNVRPPVLILTAFLEPNVMAAALELGAAGVLSKPCELEELRLLVQTVLARARVRAAP